MLLSKPQKRILELIREFGGLKRNMLFELTGRLQNLDVMLNQLKVAGKISLNREYFCDDIGKICERDKETALEILIAVTDEMPEYMEAGQPPFALTFFKMRKEKLCRYDICIVPVGKEILVGTMLNVAETKHRIIILELASIEQREYFSGSCEYVYAIKENGKYHFYKGD